MAEQKPRILAVAAIGRNRELGRGGKLLWRIPDDLKRFRELTEGSPVILGRKTFDSIAEYVGGPLPNRINIVVTRNGDWSYDGVHAAPSFEDALEKAHSFDPDVIAVAGGASIYEAALPHVHALALTLIEDESSSEAPADAFFPPYEELFPKKVFEEEREWNGLRYRWVDLERED